MTELTQLTVTAETHPKGLVMRPQGRLDGSNAGELEKKIQDQLDDGNVVLIFDFAELKYISSAGLRILLVSARDAQSKGGKAVFCGLSKQIAEIFSVSGFDKILSVYPSINDAAKAL